MKVPGDTSERILKRLTLDNTENVVAHVMSVYISPLENSAL